MLILKCLCGMNASSLFKNGLFVRLFFDGSVIPLPKIILYPSPAPVFLNKYLSIILESPKIPPLALSKSLRVARARLLLLLIRLCLSSGDLQPGSKEHGRHGNVALAWSATTCAREQGRLALLRKRGGGPPLSFSRWIGSSGVFIRTQREGRLECRRARPFDALAAQIRLLLCTRRRRHAGHHVEALSPVWCSVWLVLVPMRRRKRQEEIRERRRERLGAQVIK